MNYTNKSTSGKDFVVLFCQMREREISSAAVREFSAGIAQREIASKWRYIECCVHLYTLGTSRLTSSGVHSTHSAAVFLYLL